MVKLFFIVNTFLFWLFVCPGNAKGGSITVPLTSCLTGLESAAWQLTIFVFICKTDKSKLVKQEVNGTVILPPLVFPGLSCAGICKRCSILQFFSVMDRFFNSLSFVWIIFLSDEKKFRRFGEKKFKASWPGRPPGSSSCRQCYKTFFTFRPKLS